MNWRHPTLVVGIAGAIGGGAGLAATAGATTDEQDRPLNTAKSATARYHSIEQAQKDGYQAPPPGACVASPAGGMGYHFENPALMTDSVMDPQRPEILLYERKDGKFRLIGLEYYMQADQVTAAPTLFGQTFDGPMDPHHPGMKTHYDLHVWLWKDNPSGMFSQFNPRVTCP